MNPRTYIKAIAATAAATAAAGLGNAMADGNITGPEALAALGLGLVAGSAVYLSPRNADA